MKRAIEIIPAPKGYEPFKLEVKEPGTIRRIVTAFEEPSSIIPTSMGKPAEIAMQPVPGIVFEVDPDGKLKTRHFVWLPAGKAVEYPGELKFRDSYVDETTGMPLFLYEAVSSA
jgi:hypothetical protein